jgi:hypothetical protein
MNDSNPRNERILAKLNGPNTTSVSIGWSYDSGVLSVLGGGLFQVVGNVTGTYFVTVTETFTVVERVGNSTVTIQSPLSTSVSVETRASELAFQTLMGNVTNSAHHFHWILPLHRCEQLGSVFHHFDREGLRLASMKSCTDVW